MLRSPTEGARTRCAVCHERYRMVTCWACCEAIWVPGCPHTDGGGMRQGRSDGTDTHRTYCLECAGALSGPPTTDDWEGAPE